MNFKPVNQAIAFYNRSENVHREKIVSVTNDEGEILKAMQKFAKQNISLVY